MKSALQFHDEMFGIKRPIFTTPVDYHTKPISTMIPQFQKQPENFKAQLDRYHRYTVTDIDLDTHYWTDNLDHAMAAAKSVMLAQVFDNEQKHAVKQPVDVLRLPVKLMQIGG